VAEPDAGPGPGDLCVRLLLIGGDAESANRIRAALAGSTSMAFEVTHVARLAQAQDHPDAKAAEVILLDIAGRSHGQDALTQTRLRFPRIPVVVLGDEDSEAVASRVLQTGARGYLLTREAGTRLLVTTIGNALESHRTIQQLNAARERARHLASHDQLTGLANRALFHERLSRAMASARRSRRKVAVLYVDLDGFKSINDTLGHAVGDGLLRGIARQLRACLRETDSAARLGGDEFALLLAPLDHDEEAQRVAERILRGVGQPIPFRTRSFSISASIGIALFPRHGSESEDLVNKADTAMYHAKERGRNRSEIFDQAMNASVLRRASLESGLRTALESQALVLHYQPQYDVRRERIVGSEALLRWNHPELGFLQPSEFMSIAEETGLIVPIGEWVVRQACLQNAEWQNLGYPGLRISVNVSSQQFRQPGLIEVVGSALEDSGLRPENLELEITESSLLDDVEATVHTLLELKRLGVRLSIDDFGTGYSSLAYLKRLPIDSLKIDQSFVQALATEPADATITKTIVRLAQGLQLTTIAEGVETLEQLLALGSFGCARMQGYLFGRPAPPRTFLRWLTRPPFRWLKGEPGGPS